MTVFSSGAYWERRYRAGGTSGAGSYGHLAAFKASVINSFVADNDVTDVLDLGCGDGNLLSMLDLPAYIGADVSAAALERCAGRFPERTFVTLDALGVSVRADLSLSIDVIFHLVEDSVFARYMHVLFAHARRFVVIRSSNVDAEWSSPHVRHRRFTEHVAACRPEWRLAAHLPNPYAFDPERPEATSFSDFFIYARNDAGCRIHVPTVSCTLDRSP